MSTGKPFRKACAPVVTKLATLVLELSESHPEVASLLREEEWERYESEHRATVEEESKQLAVGTERRTSYLDLLDAENEEDKAKGNEENVERDKIEPIRIEMVDEEDDAEEEAALNDYASNNYWRRQAEVDITELSLEYD